MAGPDATTKVKVPAARPQAPKPRSENPLYIEEEEYVFGKWMDEIGKKLDAKTASAIADIHISFIQVPLKSGKEPAQAAISDFWTKFDEIIPIKLRKDILESLKKGDIVDTVMILDGIVVALTDFGRKEEATALMKYQEHAKQHNLEQIV